MLLNADLLKELNGVEDRELSRGWGFLPMLAKEINEYHQVPPARLTFLSINACIKMNNILSLMMNSQFSLMLHCMFIYLVFCTDLWLLRVGVPYSISFAVTTELCYNVKYAIFSLL